MTNQETIDKIGQTLGKIIKQKILNTLKAPKLNNTKNLPNEANRL